MHLFFHKHTRYYSKTLAVLTCCLLLLICGIFLHNQQTVIAADFQLSDPGIELRRIQICNHCSKPLIVTSIAPGAAVRCPHCQHVQRRLPESELQTKIYQICPSCSCRLEVSQMEPFEAFKCGSCGLEQRVLPEAVYIPPSNSGAGKIPAEKTVTPTDRLQPPAKIKLPEPTIPGLNTPEAPEQNEFSIELEDAQPQQENTDHPVQPAPEDNAEEGKSHEEKKSFLNLPRINQNITSKVSIQVNGKPIYENEIMQEMLKQLEIYQLENTEKPSKARKKALYIKFRKEAEQKLIENIIIEQQAIKESIIPDDSRLQQIVKASYPPVTERQAENIVYRDILKSRHTRNLDRPSTSELLRYYNQHLNEYSNPDYFAVETITVYKDRNNRSDSRSSIIISKEIKEQINYEVSFKVLAKRYSEDVFSTEGGAVRGVGSNFIPANNLIKPLRKYQYSLKSGDTFGPIDLPACKLFIKIIDLKRGKAKDFETVKSEVAKAVEGNSREKEFMTWLKSLEKAAVIEYIK